MTEYSWSIASAIYSVRHDEDERYTSALAYLEDKIENGSASEVTEIAGKLLGLVAE